ncbi:hypothetical protein MKEN_01488900 [Mycena kentingensis (nom. inval.)]|nr:hypothetical protein MKEN_01488900 [Mycena kentingensis (nom. inval.)]
MPSAASQLFAGQETAKLPQIRFSRPTASILRRFTDLYKSSAALGSLAFTAKLRPNVEPAEETIPAGKGKKVVHFAQEEDVCIVLEPIHHPAEDEQDSHSEHDGSSSSSSDSSSSDSHQQTQSLDLDLRFSFSPATTPTSTRTPPSPTRPQTSPLRPALKQTSSWTSTTSTSERTRSDTHALHVSFALPTPTRPDSASISASQHHTHTRLRTQAQPLQLHALFAYTHLEHAPISYDTAFVPSAQSILSRGGAGAPRIPAAILAQPATSPPHYGSLVLNSPLIPWEIVVRPDASGTAPPPASPRWRYGGASQPITNFDVLCAVHDALCERVTQEEWADVAGPPVSAASAALGLGKGKAKQKRILRTYQDRCVAHGGGWDAGVRRIDWLEGRTRLTPI